MPGLLDTLNTLVRASLNNIPTTGGRIAPERLGKDIDGEISALRKKIDEALNVEDGMQKRLDDMNRQITQYDQQADDSLQRNDESNARYSLQQMKRLQQQAAMMQSELEEHRRSTSDFIQRVNMLEAMVADARNQKKQSAATDTQPGTDAEHAPGEVLSNLLREARERVEDTLSQISPATSAVPPTAPQSSESQEPVHRIKINIEPENTADVSAKPDQKPTQAQDTSLVQEQQQTSLPKMNIPIRMENQTPDPVSPSNVPQATQKPVENSDIEDDLARRRARLTKPD
jgi:hypothetical protein